MKELHRIKKWERLIYSVLNVLIVQKLGDSFIWTLIDLNLSKSEDSSEFALAHVDVGCFTA